ncbi:hypothetical protein DUNSADRAFT_16303 [Dunaliella salina]|uniref:Uncharacterized protein n=1 Tax=Dunaliella salina TaxID=3046 RepID=A0ABQ7G3U4_DUNSA|nr:hypothetical protein DUNSADRAFT_16303 [Dunaliella salina]|eukprot:KAF5829283.1 hypothetical protein DUNSADRAFT_16303 [Dunaliella salina]
MDFLLEYLALIDEAQAPASADGLTGSRAWHPYSKGTARAAVLADKCTLHRVAKGLDVLGVHNAGTKLRGVNRLLFRIPPGQQEKARSCITQCIASLELSRRKEGNGLLQSTAAHQHQCCEQQQQQEQPGHQVHGGQQVQEVSSGPQARGRQVHSPLGVCSGQVQQLHGGQQVQAQEAHGGQTSRRQPLGAGINCLAVDDSAGMGSSPEEPCAKRRRHMESLEEAAQDASARLHAALGDLTSLQEQVVPRREAHRRKVEAHLAERARLIKEDEDLEKEEHAIRLSKPHVYALYDEYAAIVAWENL